MNIVLTMAGKYSRFKLFGARIPKYLLPLGESTILDKIIQEFKIADPNNEIYLISNRDDQIFHPILQCILKKHKISEDCLSYIDDTSSQLETALKIEEFLDDRQSQGPICFANIDTLVMNRGAFFRKLSMVKENVGIVDTFPGKNPQYSFVNLTNKGEVAAIIDGSVVSDFACSGLYGFGSLSSMLYYAKKLMAQKASANFTDLYNFYIQEKLNVEHVFSERSGDTIVMGTPDEYVINIHRFTQ